MFEVITSISGQTGSIGYIQSFQTPTFQDIFSGAPQYYHGSSIEVQETMRVITNITDPSAIDTDLEWFSPKRYIGSWQAIGVGGIPTWEEGTYGFLNSEVQDISFRSRYTIVANPDTPIVIGDQIDLSTCNFYLRPDVYIFPDNPVPVPGYRPVDIFPQFIGTATYTAAPLADTEYNQYLTGIGLFLKPGVEGVSLNYKIAIINDIYTDYPEYEAPTCIFAPVLCQPQFSAFLANTPNVFATETQCIASVGNCIQNTWTCPSDPEQTFPYWEEILT